MRVLWLLLGLLIATSAWSQPSQVITLDEAIRIALERNATLRQAQIGAALDAVAVSDAWMQFVPDVRASASGSQNYGRYFDEREGRIVEQTTNSVSLGVSSGVTLFSGFRDIAALRQARFGREAAELDLNRAEETVIFTVARNFLSLTQQQEQLHVQRENLAAETQLEAQIKLYVEAGARPAADLYQQQANLAAAKFAVVEAESAAESSQVDLMRTLQLDPAGIYDFQGPKADQTFSTNLRLQEILDRAFASRTDLQAVEARLAAAEQSVRIAHAGYWPSLSLNGNYGSAYTDASPDGFNEQLDQRRGGSVFLNLSIPLFDRNATRNASRRARLQVLQAKVAFENARHEIGLEVRQVYLDYRAARERFTAAEIQWQAAERAVQAAQERFKAGNVSLIELSQAQAGFVRAESAVANARSSLAFQHTVIEYYSGTLSHE
jgi:outer membrane protein